MKLFKRSLFIIMTLLLVVLAACGDKKVDGDKEINDANNKVNNEKNNNNAGASNSDVENLNATGMPIVNEPITLKMFTSMHNTTMNNWDDILVWNHYEDMTGIHVDFEQNSAESLDEKRNLALASGTLPDIFFAANLPPLDLFKYGSQGTFIPLNDLIEEHAPNLMALMDEDPGIRKAMTFPDGKIYSLPYLVDPEFTSLRTNPLPYFNEETLEAVGMDVPETLDEYYDFLVAVKEDSSLNKAPLGVPDMNHLFFWLEGSFDVGNTGRPYIDKDPETGDIRFYSTSENYKELLEFVNKLYSEELIEQNVYTIEWDQFLANGSEEKYASTVFYAPSDVFGEEAGSKYIGALPLEGPHGDRKWVNYSNPVLNMGKFAITSENEYPEASIRWVDHFYSDEGSELWYMGIEGETFEYDSDGIPKYLAKITDSPEGLSKNQELAKYLGWVGLGAPGILKEKYFDGSEATPQPVAVAKALEPYLIDEPWPAFTYTEEEAKVLSSVGADIEKYTEESRDKFITGELSFDKWDKYVDTLNSMGLDDYMEIQATAYERYSEN